MYFKSHFFYTFMLVPPRFGISSTYLLFCRLFYLSFSFHLGGCFFFNPNFPFQKRFFLLMPRGFCPLSLRRLPQPASWVESWNPSKLWRSPGLEPVSPLFSLEVACNVFGRAALLSASFPKADSWYLSVFFHSWGGVFLNTDGVVCLLPDRQRKCDIFLSA